MSLSAEDLKLIGGSDAAAVAGVHPYKSPIDVYRRIVEGYETEETQPMRRGNLLEPVILQMYREKTGYELLGKRSFRFLKWGRASLDEVAMAQGGERGVEAKSVNAHVASRYGDGPDDVPIEHICQTQFYMGVSGLRSFDVVPLLGDDMDIRIYTLQSDHEMQEMLFEACERFHMDHIAKKMPPTVDGSESYSQWLKERYPANHGSLVTSHDLAPFAARLFEVREAIDALDEEKKQLQQRFMSAIGEADGVEGPGFRVTWKLAKGAVRTDFEAACAEAGVPQHIIEKHTRIGAGSRRFLPTKRKQEQGNE